MSRSRMTAFVPALALASALAQEPVPQPPPPAPADPTPAPPPAAIPEPKPLPFRTLDDGLLQEAWFKVSVDFRPEKEIDFFWMKPGLDLAGRKIRLPGWEPAAMLKPGRDEKDFKKAAELTYLFPLILRNKLGPAFGSRVKLSSTEGDLVLMGRLVDVNAGSQDARLLIWMGAGSSTATWDLKLVDAHSGDLLLAVHHRCISGSAMTEVQDKMEKWSRAFAKHLCDTALR